jgi:hypothetical protein
MDATCYLMMKAAGETPPDGWVESGGFWFKPQPESPTDYSIPSAPPKPKSDAEAALVRFKFRGINGELAVVYVDDRLLTTDDEGCLCPVPGVDRAAGEYLRSLRDFCHR